MLKAFISGNYLKKIFEGHKIEKYVCVFYDCSECIFLMLDITSFIHKYVLEFKIME